MGYTYDSLYQDIDGSSGGDFTSTSGGSVGNTGIAGTLPAAKPPQYKSKIPKGGKRYKKPSKPLFKTGTGRGPDDPEHRDPVY